MLHCTCCGQFFNSRRGKWTRRSRFGGLLHQSVHCPKRSKGCPFGLSFLLTDAVDERVRLWCLIAVGRVDPVADSDALRHVRARATRDAANASVNARGIGEGPSAQRTHPKTMLRLYSGRIRNMRPEKSPQPSPMPSDAHQSTERCCRPPNCYGLLRDQKTDTPVFW